MRIALLGTRGVPARYGGFETAVEEVGRRLADRGHQVVVYCRTAQGAGPRPARHLGMELVHLPAARKRSLETLSHSALSVAHLLAHRTDAAIVFNAANAPLLPAAARRPHPRRHARRRAGVEARQVGPGRPALLPRRPSRLAVRWSDALIADAQGIADYYRAEFGAPTDAAHLRRAADRPGLRPARRARPRPRAATTWWSPGSSRRTTST